MAGCGYNYQQCNRLLGDIVKVTPSSKSVGDMAFFDCKVLSPKISLICQETGFLRQSLTCFQVTLAQQRWLAKSARRLFLVNKNHYAVVQGFRTQDGFKERKMHCSRSLENNVRKTICLIRYFLNFKTLKSMVMSSSSNFSLFPWASQVRKFQLPLKRKNSLYQTSPCGRS